MIASAMAFVPTDFPPKAMSAVRAPPVTAFLTADSIRAAADLVFGTIKTYPTTKMPIDLSAEKNLPDEKPAPLPKKSATKKGKDSNPWAGKC